MSHIVSFATAASSMLYLEAYGFFGLSSCSSVLSLSSSESDRADSDEEPPESCRTHCRFLNNPTGSAGLRLLEVPEGEELLK